MPQAKDCLQARLAYAMDKFLAEGRVPSVHEGNKNEPLVPLGKRWAGYGQVVLGTSLEKACCSPTHLAAAIATFPPPSPYVMTYRPDKDKVYVVLREGAGEEDALEGAFLAHLWLDSVHRRVPDDLRRCMCSLPSGCKGGAAGDEALAAVRRARGESWREFRGLAIAEGWDLGGTMLAIGDTRLLAPP